MKFHFRLFILVLCYFLTACVGNPSIKEEKLESPSLYFLKSTNEICVDEGIPDHTFFPISKIKTAIQNLLDRSSATPNSALIIYVHGRAAGAEKEPEKSLKNVLPCLEKENSSSEVLMFYWPGSAEGGRLGFPEDQARKAASDLEQVLIGLKNYKEENKRKLRNKKVILLLHSMGNIVFEEFVRTYERGSLPDDLCDNIILSASASAAKDHSKWLKKANFSKNIYVMVNNNDPVIDKLGMRERKGRLGKKLKTIFNRPFGLAPNAIYVDISKAEINKHRYFLTSGPKNNPHVREFFDTILRGLKFDFENFNGLEEVENRDGTKIYYLKRK